MKHRFPRVKAFGNTFRKHTLLIMFILKLICEVAAVLGLALVLRRFIGIPSSLSLLEDSRSLQRRLKGEWQWYSVVHIILGVVFSITAFWLIYGIFLLVHSNGDYEGVLIVNQAALMVPAMILGFLTSEIFSRTFYSDIFGMSDAIFDRIESVSKTKRIFQRFFGVALFATAFALLSFQYHVFLKTDGEHIYMGSLDQTVKTFAITDIERVSSKSSDNIDIILANGEHITTAYYSGNVNYFLDNISR